MPTLKLPTSPEEADAWIKSGCEVLYDASVIPRLPLFTSFADVLEQGLPDSTVILVIGRGWRRWRTQAQLVDIFTGVPRETSGRVSARIADNQRQYSHLRIFRDAP